MKQLKNYLTYTYKTLYNNMKEEVQQMYDKFFVKRQSMKREPLFDLYNQVTGHKMKPSNCSSCLLRIKAAFESYLAENQ